MRHHTGAHGISFDITITGHDIVFDIDNGRFETSFPQGACAYLVGKSHAVVHNRCNIPAWKKMGVDWGHIFSGHMEGGSRAVQSGEKSLFPNLWGEDGVKDAVEEAYKNGKKIMTQDDRILLRGTGRGTTIDMWVNTATKMVETAYPVH